MISVLVCDDNDMVRRGLCALIEDMDEVRVLSQASNGQHAVEEAKRLQPELDLVLLDVQMPVMDGVTAVPHLVELAPVLMLTYTNERDVVTRALQAGAAGYLVHGEFDAVGLERAIRDVIEGGAALSAAASSHVVGALREPNRVSEPEDDFGLSPREREVLDLIVAGRTNQQIANELFVTYKTVKNHVNNLFRKLGASSRTAAVAIWLGLGDDQ